MANEQNMTLATADTTTIATWLDDKNVTAQIAGALAGYVDPATFRAQCALAVNDPNLLKCSLPSLLAAFLKCAQMGLLPGKHHGHVALIPRKNKDNDGFTVDVMPQWQGFKFLMEKQEGVKRVTPILVHASDEFTLDNGAVHHSFDPFNEERQFLHPSDTKDGKTGLRGAFLKIEHDDGEARYHFMSAAAIEKRRMCSQTPDLDNYGKPGVWRKWYGEQCLKTVLRDAWARRAVSIDPLVERVLGEAASVDDAVLGNDPARVAVPNVTPLLTAENVTPPAEWQENDRRAFMAELSRLGCKYDDVKAWLLAHKKPAPRDMTETKRRDLVVALGNGLGEKFRAWLSARSSKPVEPRKVEDAEMDGEDANRQPQGNGGGKSPGCGVCGEVGKDLTRGVCFDCASDPDKNGECQAAADRWQAK